MAGSQGPKNRPKSISPSLEYEYNKYDDNLWKGFDFLLSEMKKRKMKAIVTLNNFWDWSGGFEQYLQWFGIKDKNPYKFYTN